jgi:hypothetical protein
MKYKKITQKIKLCVKIATLWPIAASLHRIFFLILIFGTKKPKPGDLAMKFRIFF